MYQFSVADMSCGHCVAAIEKAIKQLDAAAEVVADLGAATVSVRSTGSVDAISAAIREAGYDNRLLNS